MAAAGLKGLFQQYLFRVGLKGKGLREWVRMVHGIRTRLWAKHLLDHGDELGLFLPSFLSEEERLRVGLRLQILVSKLVFSSGTSYVKFFNLSEGVGVHVLPLHFYSPVPQPSDLGNETFAFSWEGSPYLRLAPSEQLAVIRRISPLATELDLLVAGGKTAFQWYNRKFDSLDAALYYGLIRLFKPSKIVEVGSGYSTLVAQAALEANEVGSLTSVDPHPPEFLTAQQHPRIQLIPQRLQDVPLTFFEALEDGDFLFVDGSHVVKTGSDVNHLYLKILPRIKARIVLHIHDIFLPFEYPQEWLRDHCLFWNEQYLVLALLLFHSRFEILALNYYLARIHQSELASLFPFLPHIYGCSLWLKYNPQT